MAKERDPAVRTYKKTRRTWRQIKNNEPIKTTIQPSSVAVGVGVMAFGAYILYDLGRSRADMQYREAEEAARHPASRAQFAPPGQIPDEAYDPRMGALPRHMGGRGPTAGTGVAPYMGRRSVRGALPSHYPMSDDVDDGTDAYLDQLLVIDRAGDDVY